MHGEQEIRAGPEDEGRDRRGLGIYLAEGCCDPAQAQTETRVLQVSSGRCLLDLFYQRKAVEGGQRTVSHSADSSSHRLGD